MKSLLFQEGATPFSTSGCEAIPCRDEVELNIRKNGRIYRYVLRDKLVPDDPYLVMVKAAAFAQQTGEAYNGTSPSRNVKDYLIKDSVVI